jgi:hypothetical protein
MAASESHLVSSSLGNDNKPSSPPFSATITEPTFVGRIVTTDDAVRVISASQRGLLPRITRNLDTNELSMIHSGSVFVYEEKESGIKTWNDGLSWGPAKVTRGFSIYQENERQVTKVGENRRGRSRRRVGEETTKENISSLKPGGLLKKVRRRHYSMSLLTQSYLDVFDTATRSTPDLLLPDQRHKLTTTFRGPETRIDCNQTGAPRETVLPSSPPH